MIHWLKKKSPHLKPERRANARFTRLLGAGMVIAIASMLFACPAKPAVQPISIVPATQAAPVPQFAVQVARRQVVYLSLADFQFPANGGKLLVDTPAGEGTEWVARQVAVLERKDVPATRSGPGVEQLTGSSTHAIDAGGFLVPARVAAIPTGIAAAVNDFSRVVLRWEIPAAQPAGKITVPLQWEYVPAGGRTVSLARGEIELYVSDITLPAERAIHTVATTTMERLGEIFPSFSGMQGNAVDRADPTQKPAMEALDELVTTAERNGVVLSVENLCPTVHVDEVGRVQIDWDAYDRVVSPWMEGTAFADRLPLDVWVAPEPPRRIAESAGQVRQFWAACLAHYHQKGWTGTALFLHPALMAPGNTPAGLAEVVAKDVEAAAVVAINRRLDDAGPVRLLGDHLRMWVTDDADMVLPPCGALATPESVRVWPWACQARGLAGMVWRDAVRKTNQDVSEAPPLIAVSEDGKILQTTRMAWLAAGISDAERFGLLKKRSDINLANEVLAGVVGRTGSTAAWIPQQQPQGLNAFAPATRDAGYLYAGWSTDPRTWSTLPSMLDALILENAPGQQVRISPDDPRVLAAKMWLAQAHRPTARTGAYQFDVSPGKDGAIVTMDVQVGLENPIGEETTMSVKWGDLPGDLMLVTDQPVTVKANERRWTVVRAEGRVNSFAEQPAAVPMEWTERLGGTQFQLPGSFPVYAMPMTNAKLTIDGKGDDWPMDPRYATYPAMRIDTRYANRPQLAAGKIETFPQKAGVRWMYDQDHVYALVDIPQTRIDEQKTSEWPLAKNEGDLRRWWGTDGVEVLIAGGSRLQDGSRIADVAVKPGGPVLSRMGKVAGAKVEWVEAPQGLEYGIATRADGYSVELAMPRKWFESDASKDPQHHVWRVNVLRHARDQPSTSWSGPVVDDVDVGMMGLLIGEK